MKPFNYKECMEKHGGYAVTRDGLKVRLLCDDRKDPSFPIVGMVTRDGREPLFCWTEDGEFFSDIDASSYDLFTPTKTVTYWANVYKGAVSPLVGGTFSTESEAKFTASSRYIKTISFELEE